MATITNYISLVDGVSPVMQKIADVSGRAFDRLEGAAKAVNKVGDIAETATGRVKRLEETLEKPLRVKVQGPDMNFENAPIQQVIRRSITPVEPITGHVEQQVRRRATPIEEINPEIQQRIIRTVSPFTSVNPTVTQRIQRSVEPVANQLKPITRRVENEIVPGKIPSFKAQEVKVIPKIEPLPKPEPVEQEVKRTIIEPIDASSTFRQTAETPMRLVKAAEPAKQVSEQMRQIEPKTKPIGRALQVDKPTLPTSMPQATITPKLIPKLNLPKSIKPITGEIQLKGISTATKGLQQLSVTGSSVGRQLGELGTAGIRAGGLLGTMTTKVRGLRTALSGTVIGRAATQIQNRYGRMSTSVSTGLQRLSNGADKLASKMDRLGQSLRRSGHDADEAGGKFGSLGKIFAGNLMASLAMDALSKAKEAVAGIVATGEAYAGVQARLNLVAGSQANAAYLNEQIFQSAQRARGGYLEMAGAVAQIAMSAKDAFPDPREAVTFMEGIQKLFVIGGTSKENQKFAMLQLTQGLASGQLQGDEFRSIAENAPIIENMIAKTMGVSRGELKGLASEGKVTAAIIKQAILENMTEIDKQFMQMPMRWGDLTSIAANAVIHEFEPVFNRLSELANSPGVKKIFLGIVELAQATAPYFYSFIDIVEWTINTIVDVFGAGISFLQNNMWLVNLALIIAGAALLYFAINAGIAAARSMTAATATGIHTAAEWVATGAKIASTLAQEGLNAAIAACPLSWMIGLIVALIVVFYGAVAAVNYFAGTSISATGIIFGAFGWLFGMIYNLIALIWNNFAAFANFLANVFKDPLHAIWNLFADIWNGVVDYVREAVNSIIELINKIPGIDKVLGGKVELVGPDSFRIERKEIEGGEVTVVPKMNMVNVGNMTRSSYDTGTKVEKSVLGMLNPTMLKKPTPEEYDPTKNGEKTQTARDNLKANKDTAKNTKQMADKIEMTADEIKELRDSAVNQAVSNWQQKNVTIHMNNNNTFTNEADIDGFTSDLLRGLRSAATEKEEGPGGGI